MTRISSRASGRFLGNWPAVNQNKINRTAKIAKSYARVSLSNINVQPEKSSVRQIAFGSRDFRCLKTSSRSQITVPPPLSCMATRKIES